MNDNEAAERLRDAIAEIVGDPAHAECRTTEHGPVIEANCIVEGLFHRGYDAALAHERSAGAAPLDVERLAHAIHEVNCGEDAELGHQCPLIARAVAAWYRQIASATPRAPAP